MGYVFDATRPPSRQTAAVSSLAVRRDRKHAGAHDVLGDVPQLAVAVLAHPHEEVERVGLALMKLEEKVHELAEQFGLRPSDLNINLGPLGDLL